MTPKTPRLTAKEILTILGKNGFIQVSQSGSHLKLFNPVTRRIAILPIHAGKILPIGTLKAIEKQADVKF